MNFNHTQPSWFTEDVKDQLRHEELKVMDVICFGMSSDYICPYYKRSFDHADEEAQKKCFKCWHPSIEL